MPPIYNGSVPVALKRGSQALKVYCGSKLISGGGSFVFAMPQMAGTMTPFAPTVLNHQSFCVYKAIRAQPKTKVLLHNVLSAIGQVADAAVAGDIMVSGYVEVLNADRTTKQNVQLKFAGNATTYTFTGGVIGTAWATADTTLMGDGDYFVVKIRVRHPTNPGVTSITCPGQDTPAKLFGTVDGNGNLTLRDGVIFNPTWATQDFTASAYKTFADNTAYFGSTNQYRPLAVKGSGGSDVGKSAIVIGDSIAAPTAGWVHGLMLANDIANINIAKSGEMQSDWPAKFAARSKSLPAHTLVCEMGRNGVGTGVTNAVNSLKAIWAAARAAGVKKVIQSTITPYNSARLQISSSAVDATGILTVTAFTTGTAGTTPIEADMAIKGTGIPTGTKIAAYGTNGTTGTGGTGTYQLVASDGSAYAGTTSSNATVDTWNSTNLNAQAAESSTNRLNINIQLRALVGQADGPDAVFDLEPIACDGTLTKWKAGYSTDGTHHQSALTSTILAEAASSNWAAQII